MITTAMSKMETSAVTQWLDSFRPAAPTVSWAEQARGALGALVGILLTGLVSTWFVGAAPALPFIIAPMGASAVLMFAVPSSPLAQPWSIIGGNLVASLVGVSAARMVPDPTLAASGAIGIAIGIMFFLRCVHPPSGAVALTAVLGGSAVAKLGYGFVLAPVLLNSVLITLVAIAFNNATRRRYPHAQRSAVGPHGTRDKTPTLRLGFAPEDLDKVLKRYDQVLDIARSDMDALLQAAEMQSFRRRFGSITCADIMSRDVISVEWGTPLADAWDLMRRRKLRSLPVVDKIGRVLGLVEDMDFLKEFDVHAYASIRPRFRRLMYPVASDFPGTPEVAGQIMAKDVKTVTSMTNVVDVVLLLADSGRRHVPVVDESKLLVGIISQSDLIGALYQTSLSEEP